jgi:DNA-binding transcriptional LysR family regulator
MDPDALARFDWTLVRSFLAVLDAGSVTAAAKRSGAQQPTLSRHVAELETQLGVPLFERTGRGVTPTGAALAIAEAARRMQDAAIAVGRGLASARSATKGVVRVTTSQVAAAWLMPPVLAALQRAHPEIEVELVASNEITNLLRREADIAVRMVRPAQGSLVARKLADIPIVACAHKSYLKRAGTPHQPADLLSHRHTLLGYDKDPLILRAAAQMGLPLTREHFALRTDDQVAYGRLIAAGAGIGFAAGYNLRSWRGVVPLLPMLQIPPLPCWLAVHREIRGSAVVRRVYEFLAQAIPQELEVA